MAEREAKFIIPNAEVAEALRDLGAVGYLRVRARKAVEQRDVYYDTSERTILNGGGSLRVRYSGTGKVYTLKTGAVSGASTSREEIEEPADDRDLPAWLEKLRKDGRLPSFFPTQPPVPVLEIHNRREKLDLEDGKGAQIEMVVDTVRFTGPRGQAEALELELELQAGPESALDAAVSWLAERFVLPPSEKSKYQLAVSLVG